MSRSTDQMALVWTEQLTIKICETISARSLSIKVNYTINKLHNDVWVIIPAWMLPVCLWRHAIFTSMQRHKLIKGEKCEDNKTFPDIDPFAIHIYLLSLHLWWKYIVHFNYSLRFGEEERNILKRYLLLWLKTSLSAGDWSVTMCRYLWSSYALGLCYNFSYLAQALPALFAPPLVPGLTICRHVINTADYTSSQFISFFGSVAFLFSTFSLRFMHGNHLKNRVLFVLFFLLFIQKMRWPQLFLLW